MEGTEELARRLEELAGARVNDAVKLAFMKNEQADEIDGLDLTALSELRRNPGGVVEMKFIDRLEVLERLGDLLGNEAGAEALLRAMGEEAANGCE